MNRAKQEVEKSKPIDKYTQEDLTEAKKILEHFGYLISAAWSLVDLQDNYVNDDGTDIDDKLAYEVLKDALENPYIMEATWDVIDIVATEGYNLKISR